MLFRSSCLYVRVFRNVVLIVHVQKGTARGAAVNGCGSDGEAEAGNDGKIGMLSIHLVGVIVASAGQQWVEGSFL